MDNQIRKLLLDELEKTWELATLWIKQGELQAFMKCMEVRVEMLKLLATVPMEATCQPKI